MTTLSEIVNEVEINLAGYTMRQDRATHLTVAATAADTSLKVGSADNIGRGIIQIDEELIYVESFDRVSSTINVAPYGRGYAGTTAAIHTIYSKVVIAPTFPVVSIKRAINDTIRAVYPQLFGVDTHTFTFSPAKNTYSIPSDAEEILGVSFETIGSSKEWLPIRNWRHDAMANSTAFTNANSISVYDNISPGRTVQVFYSKEPTALSANADVFTTVTGLAESHRDVIVLGAAYRLSAFVDPGRLTFVSAESDEVDKNRPFGSGNSTARFLLALYSQRLNEESARLRGKYPIRIHYTR
jgi:hypothetical protein